MKVGPLAAAVVLALALWLRRRKLEPTVLAGGVIVAAGLAVYSTGLIHLPSAHSIVADLGNTLGAWTYPVVGVMAFLETGAFIGLLAPGETFLVLGGVVAGQGEVSLIALIFIVWACAVAGDLMSFFAGRHLGRDFLERHGPKVSITPERLKTVDAFFARHGGKAVFLGRFVGLVRAVMPFLAGSSGMRLRRFLPYDIVGAGIWACIPLILGYVFWQHFDKVLDWAAKGALWLGTAIVVVVIIVWLVRRLRDPERRRETVAWIDGQLERSLLRPIGALLGRRRVRHNEREP